nr:MAG TPA: RNA polymerase sigma factor [Caudoviricetes sp.]
MHKDDKRIKKVEKLLYLYPHTETCYKKLQKAVDSIRNDKYYSVIEMRFFRKMKYREIAEKMGMDDNTVYKNKCRLVELVADVLYADDIVKEIIEDTEEEKRRVV